MLWPGARCAFCGPLSRTMVTAEGPSPGGKGIYSADTLQPARDTAARQNPYPLQTPHGEAPRAHAPHCKLQRITNPHERLGRRPRMQHRTFHTVKQYARVYNGICPGQRAETWSFEVVPNEYARRLAEHCLATGLLLGNTTQQ